MFFFLFMHKQKNTLKYCFVNTRRQVNKVVTNLNILYFLKLFHFILEKNDLFFNFRDLLLSTSFICPFVFQVILYFLILKCKPFLKFTM